ncbi:hypothetical protein CYMTET_49113 [Cymbomonas tetramitiformis]|uniref:Uncharacterized protein n=1 Tax=Cymbomonas tetramitiformis TaxID=36881 RepID=A0AAE0BQR8_9CHLO|nr:hypothetical protein CYMTET_49113 [Cymbomonas tetramitiformis]
MEDWALESNESTKISKVKIWASHVRKMSVERCESQSLDRFEKLFEIELQDKHNRLQTEVHQVNTKAKFLKFVIHSGWDDFCTVNRVSIT